MSRSLPLTWTRFTLPHMVMLLLMLSLLRAGWAHAGQFDIQPYLRAVQSGVTKEGDVDKLSLGDKTKASAATERATKIKAIPASEPELLASQTKTGNADAASKPDAIPGNEAESARSTQLALQYAVNANALNTPLPVSAKKLAIEGEAAGADELVAEGDQLIIAVFGQPDLSADLIVGESGIITLPLVGTLEVKTKTVQQIAAMVTQKLEQGQYLRNPKVSVKLIQQQSRSFSVLGEVLRPGRYPLSASLSVLDGLSLAGGMTAKADKQVRLLRRASKQANSKLIEYAAVKLELENGAVPEQLAQKLKPNDILFVGQQKNFYIYGEVRKPGMYPIEEDLNIMRVLSIGGGVTERGSARRIVIHRKSADGKLNEIPAQITDKVEPGDVVYVNERIF